MKPIQTLLAFAGLFLALALNACSPSANKNSEVVMDSAYLYNKSAVLHFLQQHPAGNKAAMASFSKGVDVYRNKKDPAGALGLFAVSILQHPTAAAYYELGNTCLDTKYYDSAVKAYEIAEQLGYEPVSKLFYNIACAYSLKDDEAKATAYLEYAIEAGYANKNQIMSDPDLKTVREDGSFQSEYQDAMSGASDPEMTLWQTFKREFVTVPLPITLDLKIQVDENKNITFDFEKFVSEMRNEKFSRDVGKEFFYYAVVEDNATYTALIYAVKNTVMSEHAPYCFILISFDNKGILIDKRTVGGQLEFSDPYLVATIKPDLHFEIKQFKNVYQEDPEKDGYEDNPIVKSDLTGTEHYKIDEQGKFVPLPPELSMK